MDEKEMTFVIVTTDTNRIYLPVNFFIINSNETSSLEINTSSSFTLAFALWPYIGLISLIITVWILVYISSILSRRHNPKHGHCNFTSLYVSRDSTIGGATVVGGHEYSTGVSPFDV
ncbi:unnamed protein product [Adineta ricciae]|uniref:Uncharacterized protein n=1 Tax=Adineta ricciae TaxID=249248 RepID=A0A816GTZ1_ADIRI|nr:unnamed protein product [Adineta ricciae]CAF1679518.1 unnamed protein product [Adineta ricciae]